MQLKEYVYPKIKITKKPNSIECFTYLRKQHTDGKWYLISIYYMNRMIDDEDIQHFIALVYNHQILGKVIPGFKDHLRHSIVLLDDNQETEEERLRKYLNHEK